MTQYLEGKKVVESRIEGEYEYQKVHLVKLDDKEIIDLLNTLLEHYDDPEDAYEHGLMYSWDDFVGVDGTDIIKGIDDYLLWREDSPIEDDVEQVNQTKLLERTKTYFGKYAGYIFWFKDSEEPK